MNLRIVLVSACFLALAIGSSSAHAATIVKLDKMHLCCGACFKAVEKAVDQVDGAAAEIDRAAKTVTITASDDKTAQKAINSIGAAGFHGRTDHDSVKFKQDSGATEGKVARIELTGVHNCCRGCNIALVKAIDSVDGTEGNTAKPRSDTVVVEGNFDALKLIEALYEAGFHVQVAK